MKRQKTKKTKSKKTNKQTNQKKNIYDKKNAFSLQQKEGVLVAFRMSKLNLGPWKLMQNFLILVLHCGK